METRYHHQLLLHGVHHKVQSVAHRRSRAEQARLQELLGTSSASANVPRKRVYVEATAAESVADVMEDCKLVLHPWCTTHQEIVGDINDLQLSRDSDRKLENSLGNKGEQP